LCALIIKVRWPECDTLDDTPDVNHLRRALWHLATEIFISVDSHRLDHGSPKSIKRDPMYSLTLIVIENNRVWRFVVRVAVAFWMIMPGYTERELRRCLLVRVSPHEWQKIKMNFVLEIYKRNFDLITRKWFILLSHQKVKSTSRIRY